MKLNSPLDFVIVLCGLNLQNEIINHFPFAVYIQFIPMRHIVFQLFYCGDLARTTFVGLSDVTATEHILQGQGMFPNVSAHMRE